MAVCAYFAFFLMVAYRYRQTTAVVNRVVRRVFVDFYDEYDVCLPTFAEMIVLCKNQH